MKNKILAFLILATVAVGGFFSMYLRKEVPPIRQVSSPIPATNSTPKTSLKNLRIGILGESRSDGSQESSFNQEILTKIFEILNHQKASVIFFTGNLTLGWTKPNDKADNVTKNDQKNTIIESKNINDNSWSDKGFLYDPIIFRNHLNKFNTLVNASFNNKIAFYPMMGSHEAIGPNTTKIFEEVFKLTNAIPNANDELGYAVSIGNSFFAIIPTNYFDTEKQQIIEHAITPETISWLEKVLKEAKLSHRYLFVMGHEPAFSTPSIFNKSFSLDLHPEKRDAFWNILKENGVLAYFSSHEHVYDRSNRDGVWQVISGGGGSPLNENGENNHAFFHSLLLIIPQGENGVPSVTVLDKDGNIRDFFELNQEKQPLHQFRISKA